MRLLLHLDASGPVADRAAAAEDQRHAAGKPLAEVEIGGFHGRRRDRRGLTAGEEDVFARRIPRLRARKKRLAVGKEHVHERELVRRKGHLVRRDHVAPRHEAHARHVEVVGANHRALPAEGAGVHRLVQRVVAHDDLRVVVDLAREQPGVLLVVLEIGAGLQALLAAALDAAPRFLDRLLLRIAVPVGGDATERLRLRKIGIELALARALRSAHVARVEILRETVDGQRRLLRAEGRVQHASALPAHELFILKDHQLGQDRRVGEEGLRHLLRRAAHVEGFFYFRI